MKKILFASCLFAIALGVKAQFTVYQPAPMPQRSQTPSMGYGVPFTIYEPAGMQQYQQARPRMQEVTLTGYYNDYKGWHSTPIRVGVIGDEVRVLSVKTQYGWSNCGSTASNVGWADSEVVRDNFTYKAFSSLYGTVYF